MHIESLKYFHDVVKMKSISKAAANAHISQSALSQQVQKLEDSLGHRLLKRSNKGVEPTEMGRIVMRYAENIARTYDKLLEELGNAEKSEQTIKIEACWSISDYALPCALYVIKKKFPYHNYELVSNSSERIEEDVMNDLCEFGFMCSEPVSKRLNIMKVARDDLVLVAVDTEEFPDSASMAEAASLPFIMLTDKFRLKKKVLEEFKLAGYASKDLNVVFNVDSVESVKASVKKGYGISLLPYMAVKRELYTKQLKAIEVTDRELFYEIYFVSKKGAEEKVAAKEFMERFKEIGKRSFC